MRAGEPAEGERPQHGSPGRILMIKQANDFPRGVEAGDGDAIGGDDPRIAIGPDSAVGKTDGRGQWIGEIRWLLDAVSPIRLFGRKAARAFAIASVGIEFAGADCSIVSLDGVDELLRI